MGLIFSTFQQKSEDAALRYCLPICLPVCIRMLRMQSLREKDYYNGVESVAGMGLVLEYLPEILQWYSSTYLLNYIYENPIMHFLTVYRTEN